MLQRIFSTGDLIKRSDYKMPVKVVSRFCVSLTASNLITQNFLPSHSTELDKLEEARRHLSAEWKNMDAR